MGFGSDNNAQAAGRVCSMDKWIVHKFGGSSVADAACFRRVAEIIETAKMTPEMLDALACSRVQTPVGELGLVASPSGIVHLAFADHADFGNVDKRARSRRGPAS